MKRRDFVAAIAGLVPAAALLGSACTTARTPTVSHEREDPGAWQQITTTLRLGLGGETYKLTALYRGDRATAERYMYEQAERFVSEGAREVTFTGPVVVHGEALIAGVDVTRDKHMVPVTAELMAIVGRLYPPRTSTNITFPSVPRGYYVEKVLGQGAIYIVGVEGNRALRRSFTAAGAVLDQGTRREMIQRQADYMVMKLAGSDRAACETLLRDHAWCTRYVESGPYFRGTRAEQVFFLSLNREALGALAL